jgi:DNA-binding NtrC family response regulator
MAGGRVLIVVDEASAAESVRRALEEEGHTVQRVGSGGEARAAVERTEWDVAVVDLELPDGDGAALLTELLGRRRSLVGVALTGPGAGTRGFAARGAGAYAFLERPGDLTREKIVTVVANALEHATLRREVEQLRRERATTPPPMAGATAEGGTTLNLEERERQAILQALESTNWNKQAAAALLGLHRPTLYSKMRRHGIPQKRAT